MMNSSREGIACRIRKEREDQHLTREAFEGLSGVSAKHLYEIESAKSDVTTTTLLKICRALHSNPNYILLGENKREAEAISLLKQLGDSSLSLATSILKAILQYEQLAPICPEHADGVKSCKEESSHGR